MEIKTLELVLDEEHQRIAEKLTKVEEIPTWNEINGLYNKLKEITPIKIATSINIRWLVFCHEKHIYHAFCYEFIEKLAEEIKKLEIKGSIVEVCAGNGKLSYWLKHFGVTSIATDNYSFSKRLNIKPENVEKLRHTEVINKYHPELVIACWIPDKSRIAMDVLDTPTTKYYIDIGTNPECSFSSDCTGVKELWERTDTTYIPLESADQFSLSRLDFFKRIMPHSQTTLFEKSD